MIAQKSQGILNQPMEAIVPASVVSSLELQNSVLEIQENVEENTQKLEYFEKSDEILRNLLTAVKNDNVALMKGNKALETLNEKKTCCFGKSH